MLLYCNIFCILSRLAAQHNGWAAELHSKAHFCAISSWTCQLLLPMPLECGNVIEKLKLRENMPHSHSFAIADWDSRKSRVFLTAAHGTGFWFWNPGSAAARRPFGEFETARLKFARHKLRICRMTASYLIGELPTSVRTRSAIRLWRFEYSTAIAMISPPTNIMFVSRM